MFKCVIIDDEESAIEILTDYIEEISYLQLYKTYNKPLEALKEINEHDNIDLILLDIDMPLLSGLDLGKSIRDYTRHLIFTTGHLMYGAEAFDLKASQYLLKPISFGKFALEMDLLLREKVEKTIEKQSGAEITTFFKGNAKSNYIPVNISEISHIEALKNYVKIFVTPKGAIKSEMLITYLSIKEVESHLNPEHFIRISRSFIIAKKEIKKVIANSVFLKNDVRLYLGGHYKAHFLEYIKANSFTGLKNFLIIYFQFLPFIL